MSEEAEKKQKQEPEVETSPAEQDGRGLFVKTVSVKYERKFNLDNYESLALEFACWADREEDGDLDADMAELWKLAKAQVRAQAIPAVKARDERRKSVAAKSVKKQLQQPSTPLTTTPLPAPTQATPPPPPATGTLPPAPGQAAAPASAINKVTVENISIVRVTMPKDKIQVEFWRSGRKYPEVRWGLDATALMEIAPTLAAAGWTAAHFEAVGAEYQIPLQVHWIPSPKDAKYKDITKVVLVAQEA